MVSCRNAFCSWWRRQNANVMAVLLASLVWGGGYLAFFDSNHPHVLESEVRGEDGKPKAHFRAGDTLYVYRHWCIDRVVSGDVDVEILHVESGQFYYLGTRAAGAKIGCSRRTSANKLPLHLPTGHYEFRSKVTYPVNPLRTIVFETPILIFEIVP